MKQIIVQQLMEPHAIIHGKVCMLHMTIIPPVQLYLIKLDLIATLLMDIIAIQTTAFIAMNRPDICAQHMIK